MTSRLCISVLFCLTACGGSDNTPVDTGGNLDTGSGSGSGSGSGGDACATLAAARCTQLMTCSPADLTRRFGTLTECEARDTLGCVDALAAPGTAASPAFELACSAAVAAQSCADFDARVTPTGCAIPAGTGSDACSFSAQCDTAFCGLARDAVCGTCAPVPQVGDSCATTGCGQTLVCAAATSLCQAPLAAGGACSRALPCNVGLTCVGAVAASQTPGVCTAEVTTAGAACDAKHKTGADCSATAGLTCDTATLTCATQPLAGAGSACGVSAGIDTKCSGAATCVGAGSGSGSGSGSGTLGTCVAPAADGAPCDDVAGPTCLTPARCVGGTCTLPGAETCS